MVGTGRVRWQERATTTLEYVGLAVALAVLMGSVGATMRTSGSGLGGDVGDRLQRAVEANPVHDAPVLDRRRVAASGLMMPPPPAPEVLARRVAGLFDGRARTWSERQVSGGDTPLHVPRDDLRLTPVVAPTAVWQQRWKGHGSAGGFDAAGDARACMLCTALEWSHGNQTGASLNRGGVRTGGETEASVQARLAVASVEASARVERGIGPAVASLQARLRGTIGGEAEARARLALGRDSQDIELRGGAMAGAVGRSEGTVGIRLLGIAITQSGRAEGWAGAGARGVVSAHRDGGQVQWTLGWGAALGLGGAGEWSGSIDVSQVEARHRRLARDALMTATRVALLGAPPTMPFQFIDHFGD